MRLWAYRLAISCGYFRLITPGAAPLTVFGVPQQIVAKRQLILSLIMDTAGFLQKRPRTFLSKQGGYAAMGIHGRQVTIMSAVDTVVVTALVSDLRHPITMPWRNLGGLNGSIPTNRRVFAKRLSGSARKNINGVQPIGILSAAPAALTALQEGL